MVSKIQLPTIQPKEESAVTSSVVDVFYTPRKQPVSSVVGDIANALGTIVPGLERYQEVKEEVDISEQEAQADKDFMMQNKKDFKELVKSGQIKEGANPYYVKRYVKNSLRETARTFETELYEAYRANNLDTDGNPSAFTEFYKKFAQDFRIKNNLSTYDAESLAEGFIPYAEATRSNLNNRFIQERVANIEKEQVSTLSKFVEGELITSIDIPEEDLDRALAGFNIETLSYQEKDVLYKAQLIQNQIDVLIDDGMDASVANDTVVNAVLASAKLQKDEDLIFILDNIITDKMSGSRLAGGYKDDIAQALIDITELKDIEFFKNERKINLIKQKRKEDVLDFFINRPNLLEDIETGMNQFNLSIAFENDQNGTSAPPLSADEKIALMNLSKMWIQGQQAENIILDDTGKQYIKELNFLLVQDPSNPKIVSMIQNGWGTYFTTNQGIAYLDKYNSCKGIDGAIYQTDQRYNQVFDNLNKLINTQVGELGIKGVDLAELQETGNQQLIDFFYDTLADLNDADFLSKKGLVTQNEKKKYMFQELRDEQARILEIILPKGDRIAVESDRAITDEKVSEITGINPYD